MDVEDQNGQRRLQAVQRLRLLERVGDPALEAVTRVVAYVTGARAAAVHVLDDSHQHRIVATGVAVGSGPLDQTLCRHVATEGRALIISDVTLDERFSSLSFLLGPTPVRFYAAVPLADSEGTVIGTVCAFDPEPRTVTPVQVRRLEDLAKQAQAHIELMALAADLGDAASQDPLTGAVNSVVFRDRLSQALARARRYGREVLVAVMDVDRFKALNDSLGHPAGDQVLREVAACLRSVGRQEDTVGRLGGDEFGLIAEVTTAGATLLLERLDHALSTDTRLRAGVTVTIGTATAHSEDTPDTLIARADRAMYEAKRASNRPDPEPPLIASPLASDPG
jgi:diguanylate cyclase (GGDEF)-like protein